MVRTSGIRYFGTFNMLAIFIILGIGADNIFIFLDAWAQSTALLCEQEHEPTPLNRLSFTWRRVAQATLLTSMTTTISFMANAMSSFGAINTFGVFAGLLVVMNYLAIILYYPTVCLELWVVGLPFVNSPLAGSEGGSEGGREGREVEGVGFGFRFWGRSLGSGRLG